VKQRTETRIETRRGAASPELPPTPAPDSTKPPVTRGFRGIAVSTVRAPEGIRTPNLLIRSQMLYPLSYGRVFSFNLALA
jgi:hypothetical protein